MPLENSSQKANGHVLEAFMTGKRSFPRHKTHKSQILVHSKLNSSIVEPWTCEQTIEHKEVISEQEDVANHSNKVTRKYGKPHVKVT
jgi:hypothetical protein